MADDFGAEWIDGWRTLSDRSVAAKESQCAVLELVDRYRKLSPDERSVVDRILGEAVLSDEEWQRFDALALINEFQISSALPALDKLADRLEESDRPGAPFELKKVRRIVARLSPQ